MFLLATAPIFFSPAGFFQPMAHSTAAISARPPSQKAYCQLSCRMPLNPLPGSGISSWASADSRVTVNCSPRSRSGNSAAIVSVRMPDCLRRMDSALGLEALSTSSIFVIFLSAAMMVFRRLGMVDRALSTASASLPSRPVLAFSFSKSPAIFSFWVSAAARASVAALRGASRFAASPPAAVYAAAFLFICSR